MNRPLSFEWLRKEVHHAKRELDRLFKGDWGPKADSDLDEVIGRLERPVAECGKEIKRGPAETSGYDNDINFDDLERKAGLK